MDLETLPTEIVTHIFLSLSDIASVLSLSATCHRMYSVFHSAKRLTILYDAVEAECGPLEDIVQLITHNASQPAHIRREAPISDALIHQALKVGRVAQAWERIYPFRKWKTDFADRRTLRAHESFTFRRALYRRWLYDKAFHNDYYVRTSRASPLVIRERAALLHNYSTSELAEIVDVHIVLRDVVANNVCPSNGKIRQKFRKRFPDAGPQHYMSNIHLNYPPPIPAAPPGDGWFHDDLIAASKYHSSLQAARWLEPGAEGWGDEISHYYVVEDMVKLNPEEVLFLRDRCLPKAQVEAHIREEFGKWFINNGETLSETVGHVMKQRGGDIETLRLAVEEREMGVVVDDG